MLIILEATFLDVSLCLHVDRPTRSALTRLQRSRTLHSTGSIPDHNDILILHIRIHRPISRMDLFSLECVLAGDLGNLVVIKPTDRIDKSIGPDNFLVLGGDVADNDLPLGRRLVPVRRLTLHAKGHEPAQIVLVHDVLQISMDLGGGGIKRGP